MNPTIAPLPGDFDADERRSALSGLALAFALVVDADEDDTTLQRHADVALGALEDALGLAAGRPSHALWAIACNAIAAFVIEAELRPLAPASRDGLATLRRFLADNADVDVDLTRNVPSADAP